MRTTWITLAIMLLAGAVMYYFSRQRKPFAPYDSIHIINTADSAIKKTKILVAYNPVEVYYSDSTGWQKDSVPLKKIMERSNMNFFAKNYRSATLFLVYNNQYFYDLEINKPDSSLAFEIEFTITKPAWDTFYVSGTIDTKQDYLIKFNGPMIKMYKEFILTYNKKLPRPADMDSASIASDSANITKGPRPDKTVIILTK